MIYSHGIEFRDFAEAYPEGLNHLLFMQEGFTWCEIHTGVRLSYVKWEQMETLLEEDLSREYGDLSLVDLGHDDGWKNRGT